LNYEKITWEFSHLHSFLAEIGYFLGEEYWGRGIMSEILPAVGDWAFGYFDGEEGLERLWASIFPVNGASERVVKKSGFVFEGRMRRAAWVMDELIYSVIRED
jgi:ribosomal-protein-alanine N-acetyltransferase